MLVRALLDGYNSVADWQSQHHAFLSSNQSTSACKQTDFVLTPQEVLTCACPIVILVALHVLCSHFGIHHSHVCGVVSL
jgi:hypothetical protein